MTNGIKHEWHLHVESARIRYPTPDWPLIDRERHAVTIPDYQTIMLPLLKLASDGQERRFRDAVESLASKFELTDSERAELLPSGTAPVFDNRVGWARTYLKQAGLLQ